MVVAPTAAGEADDPDDAGRRRIAQRYRAESTRGLTDDDNPRRVDAGQLRCCPDDRRLNHRGLSPVTHIITVGARSRGLKVRAIRLTEPGSLCDDYEISMF